MRHRPPFRALLAVCALTAGVTVGTAAGSASVAQAAVADPASVVNPFIQTSAGGNDFPGADAPFGMVQWSPDTTSRPPGGGYAYADSSITGFSLTHVSGPGCASAGDVPVLPEVGTLDTSNGSSESFSHSNESADAGYYSVLLGDGVKTELTATTRSGMARFTFPSTTQADLVFKLGDSANGTFASSWNVVSSTEVSGSVTSGHFCGSGETYTVYFDMVFDQAMTSSGSSYVVFNTTSNAVVQAKVGLSYVSIANAAANRQAEDPNWNFSGTQTATHTAWNALLNKVQITGGSSAEQASFYTALYHSLLHPNVFSDTNGQYRGTDGNVHTVDSGHSAFYTTFSGWDIYRDQAQLEALIAPQQASDTAQSMVDDYAQSGMLPKWDLNDGESYIMVGDPADAILSDYYAFGARGFDTATALKDMIAEATTTNNIRPGGSYLTQLGYLPDDGSYGCCNAYGPTSTSLEYNTADAAIGWFAGQLGDTTDSTAFFNRARDWRNLFNPTSGDIQPKLANGSWESGYCAGCYGGTFVEGTGYQYTAMVPFDLRGLADDMGGNAKANSFLDTITSSLTGANGYADLTNEPSLDIPWEYDYVGTPYKTQALVRTVQTTQWADAPARFNAGSSTNDDLGAMSAWYVWSAMGMYPQTPGTSDLALGSPLFSQVVVTLPSGNTLTINGNGAADNAPYVQSATWNGAAWNNAYLPSGAISGGGTLTYTLGTSANTSWASASSSAPPSYQGTGTGTGTGTANSYSTGFESGQPQPSWTDTVDTADAKGGGISNVSGICCGLSGPEAGVRSGEQAHTGTAALMYSGSATAAAAHAYMQVVNLSQSPLLVGPSTTLSYWIFPQSNATNGSVPAGSTDSECVAIDMIFSDGSDLRDSGVKDQNGVTVHPASMCGHLTLDAWNYVSVSIGSVKAGLSVEKILLGYDQASGASGGYRGYVDDLSVGYSTGFESGQAQPSWTDTVDTADAKGGGVSNVSGICCGLSGPEAGVRSGEQAHTGTAALMYSGSATAAAAHAYMQVADLSADPLEVGTNTTLSYWIFPQSNATNGSVPAGSTDSECVAIDMIFSDGSDLRDSGVKDQNGVTVHPASMCGHLTLDAWNYVSVNVGSVKAGLSVEKILLGYDQASGASGGYRGYIDDLSIGG